MPRTIIPDRMTEVLWSLYQERGMTVPELAAALGTHAKVIRCLFARLGYKVEFWNEKELAALHEEYLAGGYASELANRRSRSSEDLLSLFRARGWKIRDRMPFTFEKRRWPADLVAAMHADHLAGMGFSALEKKYQRERKTIRGVFKHRGLQIITRRSNPTLPNGCFVPAVPRTDEEIEAMIVAARKITVPAALALDWRKWDLAKRAWFIRRLRDRIADPLGRPTGPFSENLTPFDYGTEAAWEIVRALNVGRDSRYAAAKMDIRSEGVIYCGVLWFWNGNGCGYFRGGPWTKEHGRPSLHRTLWEEAHGQPVPNGHVISFLDGNPNNLSASNLFARDRNEVCRENQAAAITRKSREKTALLLKRSQQPHQSHDLVRQLTH